MKLVETLLVRDEADIVGTQIRYHLNAGVDFVIATDHESQDGTTEILESFVRDGYLRRIAVRGEMHDGPWRTHMARLAATEHSADWVINTDADEFWMPRGGTLKELLSAVPRPYGVLFALSRHFAPRPEDEAFFAERMTVHVSPPVAINDPTSPYRPHMKVAHRGDAEISVRHGGHSASSKRWRTIHHWHPCDVLHFPFRSSAQWENKGVRRARGDSRLGQYVIALLASEAGHVAERYESLTVDSEELERGLAEGSLEIDHRLLDRVHSPAEAQSESVAERSRVIAESAAARDADIVRLYRHTDHLVARVAELEAPQNPPRTAGSLAGARTDGPERASTARRRVPRPAGALSAAVVVLLIALGLLVALPEALGDHPYDPRPSRVLHL